MLTLEQEHLLFVKERSQQDRKVDSGLHNLADVELVLEFADCLHLMAHPSVVFTQVPVEAEAPKPGVFLEPYELRFFSKLLSVILCQRK